MMTRSIHPVVVFLFCLAVFIPVASSGQTEKPLLNPDHLIQEAVENNPEILSARRKWESYKERVPQASALPDPMLGFGIVSLPTNFSFRDEDMTMKEVSVSQMFPFPGKRALMGDAANEEAQAVSKEVTEKVNSIIREVKNAYWGLSHVYRAMEVTRRNKGILESLARIVEARYAVGEGIQQDVLKAHVEVSRMVDELIMLEQQQTDLEARLCSLLNRSGECLIGEPAEPVFRKFTATLQELQSTALETSPALARMKNMIAAKEKDLQSAKREYYPDFTVRFAYGQRDDSPEMNRRDVLTGMVEVNLPIYYKSKQDRKVAGALAEIRALEAQYRGMKNEIFYMIASMASMLERAEKQLALYRTGIIPQADVQVHSALSAYTVNRVDFMSLLDSQMTLYRYELEYHGALTEYEKNLAGLEAAVGKRFSR
jgi:outer membrane protein TolC